jgi:predicted DNA-binding protein with PD1-like motif
MKFVDTNRGYILKIEPGEELLSCLSEFVEKNRIPSGYFQGIGGVTNVKLGYFDLKKNDYIHHFFKGDYELITISGNISDVEGKPFVHAHGVFSDAEYQTFAGHVFEAIATITAEIFLFPLDVALIRHSHKSFNFKELDLPHHFV